MNAKLETLDPPYEKQDGRAGMRLAGQSPLKDYSEMSGSALRIAAAGEELIQRFGYRGFSYDDIAKLVGIKKPGIHHHFPRKEDLVVIVVRRYAQQFQAELGEMSGARKSASEKLQGFARLFDKRYPDGTRLCLCGILSAELEIVPESVALEVQKFFAENLSWLSAVVLAGQAASEFKELMAAEEFAEVFLCALEGALLVGNGMTLSTAPTQLSQQLVSLMLK
ncbi:TetR/AcrR family transcriptional regulator [Pseudomonas atacamensis]|uniref:TetR/AcrR family transcriptional regulator n=1 Tax=Pseudomonas atacamensis TaxID=2565368 RepID=A0AAQ2D6P4_9PSED|nr:TetR/AcrR family transcriptional regulator [Pseudomonas atacamensis]THF25793.1 TetR/AcrR family transcriptional regulator [Pseudomonas atacamensis]